MPVEILISPPASGKTEACVARVRALLQERPFAPLRVVLPDRLQAAAFRRRLAEAGGAIGAPVGTFGDLYRQLLDRAGHPIPIASPSMVHRLVQSSIQQVAGKGGLIHFDGLRRLPGFVLALKEAFTELKRDLVHPEQLMTQVSGGSAAQQELAHLYQAFQEQLQAIHWADPEGLSWLAVEALRADANLGACLDLLVVDGFDFFTNAQREALTLLSPSVAAIFVTLPGEYPFRRRAHRRFEAAYQSLAECMPLCQLPARQRSSLPGPLRHLETGIFEPSAARSQVGESIRLLEARSPAEEARQALRWLKARVMRDGVALQACAVLTPNPALYHPHLRMAAAEFGLPLHFTQGEDLAQAPAIAALLALLELPAANFPSRLLLDVIDSPFFDLSGCGLERRSADELEMAGRFGQVIEGFQQWEEVLNRLVQSPATSIQEEEDQNLTPELPTGAQALALRSALARFYERLSPPGESRSLTGWVRWLEDLLDDWGYYEQGAGGTAYKDGSALEAFEGLREILRALVQGEAVTGVQPLAYSGFLAELRGALEGQALPELLPRSQPAALVAHILEARGVRFQALAILGLAEGIFPAVERADPFLDEGLRHDLGLESRLQRQQPGVFYLALTRSERFLLLTRPYLAEGGESWEPSPYWKAVLALLPEGVEERIRPDDPLPLSDAASAEEVMFWAVRRGSLPATFSDLQPRWEYLRKAHVVLAARQAHQAGGAYEGCATSLASAMEARYGPEHVWSASRLERYAACPFLHYIQNILELQPKAAPELGLDSAKLGTVLHAILKEVYAAAENPADPAEVLARLPQIARAVFAAAPLEQSFRPSPLWQAEQEELLKNLEKTIQSLGAESGSAGWQPVAFELPFGQQGAPPLAVTVEQRSILLRGMVDRVDRGLLGLRVIDYKTGSSQQAAKDLIEGRRLQLPLYALAVQYALNLGAVSEGFYWGISSAKASSLKLSKFSMASEDDQAGAKGPQAAIQTALEHVGRFVAEIQQAHFPPASPREGCPDHCPAVIWCWRYTRGWGA